MRALFLTVRCWWLPAWMLGAVWSPGRVCADDLSSEPRTVIETGFETAEADAVCAPSHRVTAIPTTDPAEVVAGRRSLKGDATHSTATWNEFFHSRDGLYRAGEAYVVSFDYRVLQRADDAKFYVLFRRRAGGAGNIGWKEWRGQPGERGHVETGLYTRGFDDYRLIIGIHRRGAIAIDNLVIRTDPDSRPPNYPLPVPRRTWESPGRTTYYVDSVRGNDGNDGQTMDSPWRSLRRVNEGVFHAGDRILLRSGSRWTGYLAPGGSGEPGAPVVIARYGQGPKPSIDARGRYLATLYLLNCEQVEARELDIANHGEKRQSKRAGVHVRLEDFGEAHHIHLVGLDVHDVNGSNVKKDGGGSGIRVTRAGDRVKSRFIDLRIENCHLQRTDRNGINFAGYWTRKDWFPNLQVVIRGNLLEDIGGDGIVPIGCDGALVEHNVLRGGRQRCRDAAAGIWPWSCDNTVIQFNEVSGMKGTVDGQGYDSDWNCRNTLFQYNYSHDNDGGFMLVCNPANTGMPYNIGNIGTVIRYNISQNDGARVFHISGPCRQTRIYNNVIYLGPGRNTPLLKPGNWGGAWPEDTLFANNIFYVAGHSRFDFGGMTGTLFRHNVFYGGIDGLPEDAGAILTDPRLVAPGTGGSGLDSLSGYRLRADSPCRSVGVPVPENGGRDFWGGAIPPTGPPDIGAHQFSGRP